MPATQKHRLLAIGTVLGDDKPLITSFSVTEQLGRLFQAEAELVSEDPALDFDKLVGSNATVRLELQNGKTRYFNGYISRFVQVGQQGNFARYRATLVPWLWFLTRAADCRIFQNKKVPDILEEVFKAHGFKDYDPKGISETHREWEYCVQYRETDFNFISRLMEQEGIYYYFTHEDGVHKLMLADSASAHEPFPEYDTLVYRTPTHQQKAAEEAVTDWVIEKEVQPGMYSLADFNFKTPSAPIVVNADVSRKHEAAGFEIFDHPGEFTVRGEGEAYAKVRIQELQAQHEILRAQATIRAVCVGHKFTLAQHPREDQNREYLITGMSLHARAGEFEASGAGQQEDFFSCSFTAIPAAQQFRSARVTPKPVIQGPQTAIVVGKSGEEIETDEFGRVKVLFHWVRDVKELENASCWIRVAQAWAGKGWGSIYIPRIGQEVIVEFLEGDPDRPIITGRVYNATAKVPYPLPDEKTKSTIKSNSSKGGQGFNEIRFEDKKGSEQVFIHGEKDEVIHIKNDAKEFVGNDRHLLVKRDQVELVERDKHITVKANHLSKVEADRGLTVEGNLMTKVGGSKHLTVGGDHCEQVTGDKNVKTDANLNVESGAKISINAGSDINEKAGANYAVESGANLHIKAGAALVIEAGAQLSLKVGGNFLDINPGGLFLKGTMLMLNTGGAAGSGGGSSPTAPAAPEAPDPPQIASVEAKPGEVDKPPEAPKPPEPFSYSASAKVLKYAADDGTPFCEECEKKKDDDDGDGEELAVITKIAWLDGADDKEAGDVTQWVNLPRDAKWVDAANNVPNIDRLDRKVRYKVTFNIPGAHEFKVKAEPGDDNAAYTDDEKGRNANFKWLEEEKTYTTESDGTKIVEADFFTASAGGDTFKLVAEDKDNNPPVETGLLQTKRLVYAVVIKMKDMTTAADLGTTKSEFRKHGIEIAELDPVEIDRIANIGPSEENTYKDKCKTAFNGSKGKAKLPYAVAIGFTEHLAVKNPSQVLELTGVEVGPDKAAVEIPVVARGLRSGDGLNPRKLWKDLVPGEGWFVSASYTPDGGGAARNVAEASCKALPEGSSSCGKVKVDVTGLPAGTGTIKVTVNVVDRMRGGLSFTGGNLICICTKAWWRDSSSGKQNTTAIHEMGHKVGMVADGTGKLPDKVETHYDGKGHVGPHCHFDLPVQDSYTGTSGNSCVMFGAVGEGTPSVFCEKCIPAVRKMDLSAGWTA